MLGPLPLPRTILQGPLGPFAGAAEIVAVHIVGPQPHQLIALNFTLQCSAVAGNRRVRISFAGFADGIERWSLALPFDQTLNQFVKYFLAWGAPAMTAPVNNIFTFPLPLILFGSPDVAQNLAIVTTTGLQAGDVYDDLVTISALGVS